MPVEAIIDVRDTLVARLCELANMVEPNGEPAVTFDEAEAGLRVWGRIPDDVLGEIRELHRNLVTLSGIGSISAIQVRLASAPGRQVIEALERLIAKVRDSQEAA